jgi:hypothetical protein
MKLLDLDENWAVNLGKAGWEAGKKGAKWLAKTTSLTPQGLYKTDADRIAAQAAQQNVDKAAAAVAKNKDAIANAQSQQQVAKLKKTAGTAGEKLSTAKANLKTAPQRDFTTGQKVARSTALAGTGAAVGVETDRALSSNEPSAPTAEPVTAPVAEPTAVDPNVAAAQAAIDAEKQRDQPAPATAPAEEEIPDPPTDESIFESIKDILKLSGQKAITERDNVAGIIKPKEIVALNESKQIDECGGMMSTPNQTASLSINATAGSGEEVANMLAAIMNLAGVKPVTGDMLGGNTAPMPMVKAIDIISKGSPDQMNGVEDDNMVSEPITIKPIGGTDQTTGPNAPDIEKPINDEYSNTPADPTDVPDLDANQHAYQPNAGVQGDRMDGTMPKGFSTITKESLLQSYQSFKNKQ